MTQIPFKLLSLRWDSDCLRFCAYPLRAESLFPASLQLSNMQAPLASKARYSGGSLSLCRTPGLESKMWDLDPLLPGEDLYNCDICPIIGCQSEFMFLCCTSSLAFPPTALWFLLYVYSCGQIFSVSLRVILTDICSVSSCNFDVPRGVNLFHSTPQSSLYKYFLSFCRLPFHFISFAMQNPFSLM